MKNHALSPVLKALILWVSFFLLGFLFGTLSMKDAGVNVIGLAIFLRRGVVLFFAAIFTGAVEFVIDRKRITDVQSFVFARMLSAVIVPYVFFIIWILVPSITGLEILGWLNIFYLFLAAFAGGYFAVLLERSLEEVKFPKGLIVLTVLLFVLTLLLSVTFSVRAPMNGFFAGPSASS